MALVFVTHKTLGCKTAHLQIQFVLLFPKLQRSFVFCFRQRGGDMGNDALRAFPKGAPFSWNLHTGHVGKQLTWNGLRSQTVLDNLSPFLLERSIMEGKWMVARMWTTVGVQKNAGPHDNVRIIW